MLEQCVIAREMWMYSMFQVKSKALDVPDLVHCFVIALLPSVASGLLFSVLLAQGST